MQRKNQVNLKSRKITTSALLLMETLRKTQSLKKTSTKTIVISKITKEVKAKTKKSVRTSPKISESSLKIRNMLSSR